jgi:hypothetical protein
VGNFFITIYTPLPEHVNLCGSLAIVVLNKATDPKVLSTWKESMVCLEIMAESPQPDLW